MSLSFEVPDFTRPLNAEAYIARVPPDTTCKGLFFLDVLEAVRGASQSAAGELESQLGRRYVAFRDYPLAEHMALTARAVRVLHPGLPEREAMRRLGWLAYPAFASSLIGKVIFGILGDDLERVLELGPRSFSVSLSRGRAVATRMGERHFQYDLREVYGYLDVYYVGVLEGAVRAAGKNPDVRVALRSPSDGILDIRWT